MAAASSTIQEGDYAIFDDHGEKKSIHQIRANGLGAPAVASVRRPLQRRRCRPSHCKFSAAAGCSCLPYASFAKVGKFHIPVGQLVGAPWGSSYRLAADGSRLIPVTQCVSRGSCCQPPATAMHADSHQQPTCTTRARSGMAAGTSSTQQQIDPAATTATPVCVTCVACRHEPVLPPPLAKAGCDGDNSTLVDRNEHNQQLSAADIDAMRASGKVGMGNATQAQTATPGSGSSRPADQQRLRACFLGRQQRAADHLHPLMGWATAGHGLLCSTGGCPLLPLLLLQTGDEILAALCSHSTTFDTKTEFAQAKYKKKKARKYNTLLTVLQPNSWHICQVSRAG